MAPAAAASSTPSPPEAIEWLRNPNGAYTSAVKTAIVDAMLEHSQALGIGPDEWLTVAARDNEFRTQLMPGDDSSTITFRVRGSDLAAFRAGRLTADEARRRVEIREQ